MANKRGDLKKNKARTDGALRYLKQKRSARSYDHQRARDLLREYYANPTEGNLEEVIREFDKMIEKVFFRYGLRAHNEADDFRQAARVRLWQLLERKQIDPDDAFGAYLNRTFVRAAQHEAKRLYRQRFKAEGADARAMYGWRPEISADPVEMAEAREILENAKDFCDEWAESFRFPNHKDIYLAICDFYFTLGYMPAIKDIIVYNERYVTPEDKVHVRLVYFAAVVHLRIAVQHTLRGERFHADE